MAATDNLVDSGLAKDLKGLVESGPSRKTYNLKAKPKRAPIPEAVGRAGPVAATAGGSGVASPFTEEDRETTTVAFTDPFNLWSIDVEVPTVINMLDANGSAAVFNYTAP